VRSAAGQGEAQYLPVLQEYPCSRWVPLGGSAHHWTFAPPHIEGNCLDDTFLRIVECLGCNDKTFRKLTTGYIVRLEAEH
jgi:hypothetical protein